MPLEGEMIVSLLNCTINPYLKRIVTPMFWWSIQSGSLHKCLRHQRGCDTLFRNKMTLKIQSKLWNSCSNEELNLYLHICKYWLICSNNYLQCMRHQLPVHTTSVTCTICNHNSPLMCSSDYLYTCNLNKLSCCRITIILATCLTLT